MVARARSSAARGKAVQMNWVLKLSFVVGTVVSSATVLWARQTPDALLAAESWSGAVVTVMLFAAPGLALYLWLATTRPAILIEGLLVSALTIGQWWTSATDWHSTASLGPGLLGWIFVPTILVVGRCLPLLLVEWKRGSTRPRPSVLLPVAASGLLVFFPLVGWIAVVVLWVLWFRRSPAARAGDERV